MAFDESLGRRIAVALESSEITFDEKRMFGGLGFMLNDKMCIGIVKDELMIRVPDEKYEEVLAMNHARPMDFTGRTMKGFVYVEPDGFTDEKSLQKWIDLGFEFAKFDTVKTKRKARAK